MAEEHEIVQRVLAAQADSQQANAFIHQYEPYIASQVAKFRAHTSQHSQMPMHDEDQLSIARLAFYEAIHKYDPDKGAFLAFAALMIRSRLIDYLRKEGRHCAQLSLDAPIGATAGNNASGSPGGGSGGSSRKLERESVESHIAQLPDGKDELSESQERALAQEEILHFSQQLANCGITLSEVADSCPKQERTLEACLAALHYARENPEILHQLEATSKLPLAQLSKGSGVARKTLERHRKYVVAILLAFTNGFEIIRGHVRRLKGAEVRCV